MLIRPINLLKRIILNRSAVVKNYCENRFDGKVVAISGGTKGIGFSVARRLAAEGAKVIISSRKQRNVDEAVDKLNAEGLQVIGIACHVTKKEERKNVLDKVKNAAHLGGIDALILNAGVHPASTPIIDTDERLWEKVFNTNVISQFSFVKEAIPLIKKRSEGSIVFTSSIAASIYFKNFGVYSISKNCLISLSKILAVELMPENITVNCIAPGIIDTKFTSVMLQKSPDLINQMVPLKRVGVPDDVSGVVAFLLSKDARYISGEVIPITGGISSRL